MSGTLCCYCGKRPSTFFTHMKRSERLKCHATQAAWTAAAAGSVCLALMAWTARLALESGWLAVAGCLLVGGALRLTGWHLIEWRRQRRLAQTETRWEMERAIRPRL